MTDKRFESLMARCADAYNKYRRLFERAEAEYVRRYGQHPSDVDDDYWIDSLGGGCGDASAITALQVHENAMMRDPKPEKFPKHLPAL